jgi:ABC-2 type transport system ATP-binding protein
VLSDVSLHVPGGTVCAVIGPSGCGKSTLLKVAAGLIKGYEGQVTIGGAPLDTRKMTIGFMPQSYGLLPWRTVAENIRLFGGIYGMKDGEIARKTDSLLEKLQFTAHKNDLVGALPLGWKQKLAFSISIFHEPAIVFLDEPTGGVDPATRRQFWELIYEAASRGITVFVTTHYMDEAEYCDRISIMVDGKISAMGTPEELKRRLHQPDMDHVFTYLAREAKRSE